MESCRCFSKHVVKIMHLRVLVEHFIDIVVPDVYNSILTLGYIRNYHRSFSTDIDIIVNVCYYVHTL